MPRKLQKKVKKRYNRARETKPTSKPTIAQGFTAGRQAGDAIVDILMAGALGLLRHFAADTSASIGSAYPRQTPEPAPAPPAPQVDAPNVINLTKQKDGTYQ